MPSANHGSSGSTSRFHSSRPRCHQKITSNTAGSVAVTVLLSSASTNRTRCQQVLRLPAVLVEVQICEQRGQTKDSGQRVLLLRDPCHRFHIDRVQRKNKTGQPRARKRKPLHDHHHQTRRQCMEGDVSQMIANNRIPPHLSVRARTRCAAEDSIAGSRHARTRFAIGHGTMRGRAW